MCDETHKTKTGMQFPKLRTHREIKTKRAGDFLRICFLFCYFHGALTETEAETDSSPRGMSDCRRGARCKLGDSFALDDLLRRQPATMQSLHHQHHHPHHCCCHQKLLRLNTCKRPEIEIFLEGDIPQADKNSYCEKMKFLKNL